MKKIVRVLVALACLSILWGCGSSDSDDPAAAGFLQVVNGVEDSPALEIMIKLDDDDDEGDEINFKNVGFQNATPKLELAYDKYVISISYEDPESGDHEVLVTEAEFQVLSNIIHTVVISGGFSNPDLIFIENPDDVFDDDDEQIELQVVNLSDASTTVYLSEPDLGLNSGTIVGTVTTGSSTDAVLLDEADEDIYRLRITPDGSETVVFDSGEFDLPNLSRNLIVVNNSVGPDSDSVAVMLVDNSGVDYAFSNEVAKSGLRIVNLIADADLANVDIVNSSTSENVDSVVLGFSDITEFIAVEPSFIDISLAAIANSAVDPLASTASLNDDTYYTVVVGGSALVDINDGDEDEIGLDIRTITTEVRSIATGASVQFVNGLRMTTIDDFDRVDLYALELGDGIGDTAPLVSQVPFLDGANVTLPARAFDLVVTTAGTQTILAGPIRLSIEGNTALLIAVTEGVGGGTPNRIVLQSSDLAQ